MHIKAIWKVLVAENWLFKKLFNFEIGFAVTSKSKDGEGPSKWDALKSALSCTWPFLVWLAGFVAGLIYFVVSAALGNYRIWDITVYLVSIMWGFLVVLCIWPPLNSLLPREETEEGWKIRWDAILPLPSREERKAHQEALKTDKICPNRLIRQVTGKEDPAAADIVPDFCLQQHDDVFGARDQPQGLGRQSSLTNEAGALDNLVALFPRAGRAVRNSIDIAFRRLSMDPDYAGNGAAAAAGGAGQRKDSSFTQQRKDGSFTRPGDAGTTPRGFRRSSLDWFSWRGHASRSIEAGFGPQPGDAPGLPPAAAGGRSHSGTTKPQSGSFTNRTGSFTQHFVNFFGGGLASENRQTPDDSSHGGIRSFAELLPFTGVGALDAQLQQLAASAAVAAAADSSRHSNSGTGAGTTAGRPHRRSLEFAMPQPALPGGTAAAAGGGGFGLERGCSGNITIDCPVVPEEPASADPDSRRASVEQSQPQPLQTGAGAGAACRQQPQGAASASAWPAAGAPSAGASAEHVTLSGNRPHFLPAAAPRASLDAAIRRRSLDGFWGAGRRQQQQQQLTCPGIGQLAGEAGTRTASASGGRPRHASIDGAAQPTLHFSAAAAAARAVGPSAFGRIGLPGRRVSVMEASSLYTQTILPEPVLIPNNTTDGCFALPASRPASAAAAAGASSEAAADSSTTGRSHNYGRLLAISTTGQIMPGATVNTTLSAMGVAPPLSMSREGLFGTSGGFRRRSIDHGTGPTRRSIDWGQAGGRGARRSIDYGSHPRADDGKRGTRYEGEFAASSMALPHARRGPAAHQQQIREEELGAGSSAGTGRQRSSLEEVASTTASSLAGNEPAGERDSVIQVEGPGGDDLPAAGASQNLQLQHLAAALQALSAEEGGGGGTTTGGGSLFGMTGVAAAAPAPYWATSDSCATGGAAAAAAAADLPDVVPVSGGGNSLMLGALLVPGNAAPWATHMSGWSVDHAQQTTQGSTVFGTAACIIPTLPDGVYQHTIAAVPNFKERDTPASSWTFFIVNFGLLAMLVLASFVEIYFGDVRVKGTQH